MGSARSPARTLLSRWLLLALTRTTAWLLPVHSPVRTSGSISVRCCDDFADEAVSAKAALLTALEPLDRGFSSTDSEKREVDRLLKRLVEHQAGDAPGALEGDWLLLYSDAPDIIGLSGGPLAELVSRQGEMPESRDALIVTACFRGNMSLKGMLVLQSLGYRNVKSLNGGTIGWAESGLPTG